MEFRRMFVFRECEVDLKGFVKEVMSLEKEDVIG